MAQKTSRREAAHARGLSLAAALAMSLLSACSTAGDLTAGLSSSEVTVAYPRFPDSDPYEW